MPRARPNVIAAGQSLAPGRHILKQRVWISVDTLITLGLILAVAGLAAGYQVLRRLPPAWLVDRLPD